MVSEVRAKLTAAHVFTMNAYPPTARAKTSETSTAGSWTAKGQSAAAGSVVDGMRRDRGTAGIAGYFFKGETHSPEALIEALILERELDEAKRDENVEDVLTAYAKEFDGFGPQGLNRDDADSFGADEFPKAIADEDVAIWDHKALKREYWDTPARDPESRTAESALESWLLTMQVTQPGFAGQAMAYVTPGWGTPGKAERDILAVSAKAVELGMNLEALGCPAPVRHN